MKILKKIFIFIVGLIALLLIIALFIPNDYKVTHTVTINKPQKEVYDYVRMQKNNEKWSTFFEGDPNIKLTYEGTDGTVGAKQSWNGNDDVGEGSQTITKLDGERIDILLHFVRPFEGDNKAASIIKAVDTNSCTHTEEFNGSESYPMNLMNIPMKMMLKNAFEKNGEKLKKVLEK
ncbi:SRPBCC family protein [Flavobacterium urocaniciphilum]|uniref:Polyketide cyclase / dehydrase and lipid transport n=1 Tax=Flavobacterium urocaniciphilum TaxID=1299341 RepID=A0A1H9B335_9FLAO|nr:SRPBCC family protein [Flavobacterium urocaniciphilum]SEP83470.1 hypothetical protein SAMN05444005_102480 [Flavobacterium urocaniciphilum]